MNTKQQILDLLQKQEDSYLSGEEISRLLSVSRAAVWKNIKALRQEGYRIEAVTNRGYHFIAEQDIFNEFEILKQIQQYPETQKCRFYYYDSVSSTNRIAKSLAEEEQELVVVVAKEQTQGRGRKNRSFFSPAGGIYLSIAFDPQLYIGDSMYLTMSAAVAVTKAIEEYCGIAVGIKWPNDLVYDGKKFCGILMETSVEGETGRIQSAVIGIGVNVNTDNFPEELDPLVTSLKKITGKTILRSELLSRILVRLIQTVSACKTETGRDQISDSYRKRSVLLGKTVTVMENSEVFQAKVLNIGKEGQLVLEDLQGNQRICRAGEVSIQTGWQENHEGPFSS